MEYKPVSVRESLTKMKNLSEVMMDLAYSVVLIHDLFSTPHKINIFHQIFLLFKDSYYLRLNK